MLLRRFSASALHPLDPALVLRLSAPDPESVRHRFISGYLAPPAQRLGGEQDARLRAELAVAAQVGLAATLGVTKRVLIGGARGVPSPPA